VLPKFSSRAFLAPMAGVSDPALRLQCKQMGAGLVVTEFTNIHSIVAKENNSKKI
jgi:tRNA-dihydrouridine synthase